MIAIRASATARLPLPLPSSASSPPKTATFPAVKSAAAGVQLRHDQYSVLLPTTTLSLLTLFTAAPNEAKALSLSKEHIVSSLTQVEETVGQVQEVGSNVLDIAGRVLQKVVDSVKPGVDMAVPILKQAGGEAMKIASPTISEPLKKAQEAIQSSGLDNEPVFSAAKTVADAAQQTTKVIEVAKPMAFYTVETISSSDPLAIVATTGALFLAYLLRPPVWSAIAFNLQGYKGIQYTDSAKIVAKTLTSLGFKNCCVMADGFSGDKGWLQSRLGADSYNISFAQVILPSRVIPAAV